MTDEVRYEVTSLYGANTRRPIVRVAPPSAEAVQMTPGEARALAANLLQAAEAAEQEGFVARFFGRDDLRQTAQVLQAFRQYRELERLREIAEGRET